MSLPSPEPLYLDGSRGPVAVHFHATAGPAAGAAVLLCPPFGWEEIGSYRSRRAWAQHLAGAGYPSLRLDLPGTGDSGGGPHDAALVEAWTDAVAGAARALRAMTGAARVAAAGIGLGGLLAYHAAELGEPIDDLVLWAVPARGRALVRELRAFSRLEASGGDVVPGGGLAANGFVLSAGTLAALEALDLTARPLPGAAGRRVLLLARDGIAADARLRSHLEAGGADVTVAEGDGFVAMTAQPDAARPPVAVFERTVAWLRASGASPGAPGRATAAGAPSGGDARGASAAGVPGGAAPAPARSAQLDIGDVVVQEQPLLVEQPFGRLAGVLSVARDAAPAPVAVIMLNAGAVRRIGPNRMWVETARRWAARGVPCVRVDLEGIGDADGDVDWDGDVARLYVPGYVDQVRAVMDAVQAREEAQRFILLGLCSGAYWALHAADADERVIAAQLLNPRAVVWDADLETLRDARTLRALVHPRRWRRALARRDRVARARAILRALVLRPLVLARRRRAGQPPRDGFDAVLDRLQARDVRLLLLFGDDEPLRDELVADGHLARLAARPGLRLELLSTPPFVHTLQPLDLQRRVAELLDEDLERTLAPSRVR